MVTKFLPPHQIIFLQHLANGLSYKEAAEKMDVKYSSVCNYARKICRNLPATHIAHAVAEMLRAEQIK